MWQSPTLILHAAGWLVILAALGVVELAMALYYGYRYRRLRAEE